MVTVQPGIPFRDALAGAAFAGAGDAAKLEWLIEGLRALEPHSNMVAHSIVLPLVEGMRAYSAGAYEEAAGLIEPIADDVWRIGGSNQQREMFEETLLEAYLRAGQRERAEARVRRRMEQGPPGYAPFWDARLQSRRGAA
jgi:hypothetical protein